MPPRRETYLEALRRNDWINQFEESDPCLFQVLLEACVSKTTAERTPGADRHELENGQSQVVSRDRTTATIANVYTRPEARRSGWARQLLARARRDFRTVSHSSHLSEEGSRWAESVKDPQVTLFNPNGSKWVARTASYLRASQRDLAERVATARGKFDEAYMGAQRPAYGRALKKRYGHASPGVPYQVLLFNNVARPDRAARLHAATCPMLNTAKRRSSVQRFDDPPQEDIDDLNERGFPVKTCKCLKRTP